ncbi:MAG: amidohydrolase family protein [Nocardioidaceae bacterium]
MTYDCHVHVPSSRGTWGLPYFSPESYVEYMDRLDISVSVMLPFDGLYHAARPCNDEVAAWCAAFPERLIPFGTVSPREPRAADEVTRCVETLGMRGLKLHPWMQAFHPLEPVMDPVYERARDLGIPLIFHDGTPPLSTPLQVAEVAARNPGLVVVLGHGGLNDLYGEAIEAARRSEHVWICMTSLHAHAMREIVRKAPRDRIVFGSDGGIAPMERQTYIDYRWDMVRDLGLEDAVYRAIVHENPRRLLAGRL